MGGVSDINAFENMETEWPETWVGKGKAIKKPIKVVY